MPELIANKCTKKNMKDVLRSEIPSSINGKRYVVSSIKEPTDYTCVKYM